MKKVLLLLGFLLIANVTYAQNITCTDATNTNCTIKKGYPFQVTADPYYDGSADKLRLYIDGTRYQEVPVVLGQAPLFNISAGISVVGDHTIYMEAVGTCYTDTGQASECATASLNTVTVKIVTGSVTAPKNLRVIKQ